MRSTRFSLNSRLLSFKFAFRGIGALLKNEHNARIHLIAALLAITSGFIFKIKAIEWLVLIIAIGLVFVTELLNTALESLADIVEPELNEKIRNAKDYAAGAVLVSAVISVVLAAIIFVPRVVDLFLY